MKNEKNEETEKSSKKKTKDIRERAFEFAVRIVKLCQYLEKNTDVSIVIIRQLLKAGTSVGANLEEAQGGQTKPDFITKNSISLKEARESNYWLRILLETNSFKENIKTGIIELKEESEELGKIIGSIIVSARKNT